MIGIDTNVLVRYLTQDDAAQAARATRFMEAELGPAQQGCISVVVLVEYRLEDPSVRIKLRHKMSLAQATLVLGWK